MLKEQEEIEICIIMKLLENKLSILLKSQFNHYDSF